MTPKKIIIHCSDSKNGHEYSLNQLEADHKARGFDGIGYNYIVQPSGDQVQTRPNNVVGAHCLGENDKSIGICLIGADKFTSKQFKSLRPLIQTILMTYQIPEWEIYGHYQFQSAIAQGKTCPNIPVNRLLYWYVCNDEKVMSPYLCEEQK